MKTINKKTKKILAIIMLVITVISNLSISAFANYITDINSDAQFGAIPGSFSTYGHELHYSNYDGTTYMLFCAQYGLTSAGGRDYAFDSQFKAEINSGAYRNAAQYIYFGYTMKHGIGMPSTYEAERDACATQQFLWEYVGNNITDEFGVPSRDSWNPDYMSSSIYEAWLAETENTFNNYYNTNVSFNNQTINVNIGESVTITDTNGVLASYETFEKENNGIIFRHEQGNNDLQIISNGNNTNTATFNSTDFDIYRFLPNGAHYSRNEMSSYVYFRFTSGAIQDLIFSSYVDPNSFVVNTAIQSGNIILKKTDIKGAAVEGCVFKIYKDEECTQEVGTGTSQSDGTVSFERLIPGVYYIKEVQVPKGYLINKETEKVELSNGETKTVEIINNKATGTIMIDKSIALRENIDKSLLDKDIIKDLSKIQFKLVAKTDIKDEVDGTIIYKAKQEVGTYNLSKNGKLEIKNLPMGIYELYEIKTLEGLTLDKTKYEFKFERKDDTTKVYKETKKIINNTTLTEFSKTDITGQEELEGAKLIVLDKENNVIDSWTSVKESHKIEGLKVGEEYTLKEEIAPEGYVRATEIQFKVEDTHNIQKVTMVDKIVEVTKTDLATGEELAGAELIVTDKDGNEIDKWISGKEAHHVKGLEEGKTYTLTEITCPNGYEKAESIEFTVTTDKENQKIEMKDKPIIPVIQTGNEIDNNVLLGLIIISIIGITTGIIICKRKKEKRN